MTAVRTAIGAPEPEPRRAAAVSVVPVSQWRLCPFCDLPAETGKACQSETCEEMRRAEAEYWLVRGRGGS